MKKALQSDFCTTPYIYYAKLESMFYYFKPIVNINRVEKCMNNKYMKLYGEVLPVSIIW